MPRKSSAASSTWRGRLGPHHFAYLRALAEGVDVVQAARRYLGMDHGHQLRTLHRDLVDQLRARARRAGDSRWRLIGLRLEGAEAGTQRDERRAGALPSPATAPQLDAWAEQQGLQGWSEAELLDMYLEAHGRAPPGQDGRQDRSAQRRLERLARLRKRQLAVLAEIERAEVVPAAPHDPLQAWFDPATSERLIRAGFVTLADLQRAITIGGRWYRGMPGTGPVKAQRIAQLLAQLLPQHSTGAASPGAGAPQTAPPRHEAFATGLRLAALQRGALDGSSGANRSLQPARISATDDLHAIGAWIQARAGSPLTAAVYRREAERWLLWCVIERGKAMSSAGPEDCVAYMAFLNRVPASWMSRRKAARHELGWTPFRGQPGLAARRLAVTVLRLMCEWLTHQGRYLDSNPWAAVNTRLVEGDDVRTDPGSRALSRDAYAALLAALPDPQAPGATRNGFVLVFCRHTGLRASELLSATVGDFSRTDDGWLLRIVGKGRKERMVSVSTPAVAVLREYLRGRGLAKLEACDRSTPLLGCEAEPLRVPTYSAVYQGFRGFVRRAVRQCALPPAECAQLARASQHWLRHTFATRWAEADGPMDVLQAELGHASPATTARYFVAQQRRRQREVERVSGLGE